DDLVGEETDTPVDDLVGEETDTPTDDLVGEETDTPVDDVVGEETDTPTDDLVGEETDTPTDDVVGEETDTPTDDLVGEETDTPGDNVSGEEDKVTNNLGDSTSDENTILDIVEEPAIGNLEPTTQNTNLEQNNGRDSAALTEENSVSDTVETSDAPVSESEPTATESEVIDNEPVVTEENSVSEPVETSDAPVSESEPTATESEVIDNEPVAVEQEDLPVETEPETVNAEELSESKEIVEELIEEAKVREIRKAQAESEKNSQEVEEEAIQEVEEEVTKEEIAEKKGQEDTEEEVAQEEEEVAQEEEEEVAEEQVSEAEIGQLDRVAYETQFQEAPNDLAILMQEEFQLTQLIDTSGIELYGSVPSVKDISRRLAQLAEQTGQKPAFINISLQSNQLESFVVLPEQTQADAENSLLASSELNNLDRSESDALAMRKTVKDTSRKDIIAAATEFREEISDVRKLDQSEYKRSAQELYDVLIRPIEAELEANNIDVLVFSMDSGLRLLPVAALHDGEQFLIEKYAMGIVPSFGLTDTRYVSPTEGSILAMGASEFEEQAALPTMPIELQTIVSNPRRGESFLNEQFTIPNFIAQNSREAPFSIIHLGTHAEFKAGSLSDSYIQFYDEKLKIPQLQQLSEELGWNSDATPIELLVLSACETALGDQESELGFAGLAVQAGVKSALASLWYVSDLGTLALMGEFYDQLGNTLVKAEALRQTQLEMLKGNVMVDDRQVKLSNGVGLDLAEDFPAGSLSLDHPYFWSSFTLIGNWN
ncbi:MAG: CHAT domain-containing protein, partial [Cyanobacteria bacterium J06555_3]